MHVSKIYVTVDAVVIRESPEGKMILLIRRKNEPFKGAWALPGGFVDEGEDLDNAVMRELQEETGLNARECVQLKAFGKPGRDPRHHTVSVAFLCKVDDAEQARAADDADLAQWFRLDELPELAFDHDEIIAFAKTRLS